MSRHIIDSVRRPSQRRIAEFVRISRAKYGQIERGEAFRTFHKAGTGSSLRAFLKVERGYRA